MKKFMRRTISVFLFVAFLSCTAKQSRPHPVAGADIEIEIVHAQSYRYDLKQQTYTVMRMEKADTTVRFRLTDGEKNAIAADYFARQLDERKGKIEVEDDCRVMPKLYTVLKTKSHRQTQEIVLDEACDRRKGSQADYGEKVAAFLSFVESLLQAKPEIRNVPPSDILYL